MNEREAFAKGGKRKRRVSGGHGDAPPGAFLAAGPAIRSAEERGLPVRALVRERLRTVGTVYDVAPTILALLAVPVGEDMRGHVMADLFDPAFLDAHPVRTVATHDTPEWLAARPEAPEVDADTEERLEQLRQLGYIN